MTEAPSPPPAQAQPQTAEPATDPAEPATDPAELLRARILFAPGSVTLDKAAISSLTGLALVLLDHPELGKIEVQGFATGSAAESATRSLARAENVMIWLVEHGVSPGRLSARGYGATQSDHIEQDHVKERVELHLVQPDPPSAE